VTDTSRAEPAAEFIERFSAAMVESGMPRMSARVFALLLCRDDGAATAGELSSELQASAAAISGAVRYLIQVHLVARTHRPGDRRDVYRLLGDNWYEMVGNREREMAEWAHLSREGGALVGPDTRAGRRLNETARFFDYLGREWAALMERWHSDAHKE
jgi:predicted transcriptional regulator